MKLSDGVSRNEAHWVCIIHCINRKNRQNVNIVNKFDSIMILIENASYVLISAETKLDSAFPKGQFKIPGYKPPYRFDMPSKSGGPLVLVNDQLSFRLLREIDIAPDI